MKAVTFDDFCNQSSVQSEGGSIRELSLTEIELVSGGWTWNELGASMVAGGVAGAAAALPTGAGVAPSAVAGALIGGIAYLTYDGVVGILDNYYGPGVRPKGAKGK